MLRVALATLLLLFGSSAIAASKPNILFILTDDQDLHMNSLDYMSNLQSLMKDQGTTFPQHYCTVAQCCPSRATLWTGRVAHNTNVTDVSPPYGGYPKVVSQGINDNYLPIWLQNAGYNTYYTGKLWNAFNFKYYQDPPVKGWTGSDISVDPNTYYYFNGSFTRNGADAVNYKGQYIIDVTTHKAMGFLDDAIQDIDNKPFFLVSAPVAPHAELLVGGDGITRHPQWAPRYDGMFNNYQIPRTDNFNPNVQSGASWIKNLPQLNDSVIARNDRFQIARLRALQAVDDMIAKLIKKLEDNNLLNNTYIFFSTDNGFHISTHRMLPGKMCAFEEDINIPLIVRGPGIGQGQVANGVVSSHTDLAPTILKLAGAPLKKDFDGAPVPLTPADIKNSKKTEYVNAEFWGTASPAGILQYPDNITPQLANNTYKAVRMIGEDNEYNLFYSVWCTNEHEFYDMSNDPGQQTNFFVNKQAASQFKLFGRSFKTVAGRLNGLILVLKTCKAQSCRKPWNVIHQNGKVSSLKQALHKQYDHIYNALPNVSYSVCAQGYIKADEGPDFPGHENAEQAIWPDWT